MQKFDISSYVGSRFMPQLVAGEAIAMLISLSDSGGLSCTRIVLPVNVSHDDSAIRRANCGCHPWDLLKTGNGKRHSRLRHLDVHQTAGHRVITDCPLADSASANEGV